jgi:hypothetical protein
MRLGREWGIMGKIHANSAPIFFIVAGSQNCPYERTIGNLLDLLLELLLEVGAMPGKEIATLILRLLPEAFRQFDVVNLIACQPCSS